MNILPIVIANNSANAGQSDLGNIALLVGYGLVALFILGAAIRFTILDILDAPRRRAVKISNAKVDAIRAATRARNEAKCKEIFASK